MRKIKEETIVSWVILIPVGFGLSYLNAKYVHLNLWWFIILGVVLKIVCDEFSKWLFSEEVVIGEVRKKL